MENLDEHVGQRPSADRTCGESGAGGDSGLGPYERAELASVCSERGSDGEGSSAFGEPEPQGQPGRRGSERERKAELDTGEADVCRRLLGE